uniref:AbrB/MazE/SpoVT family DNA-binding domain-containing protein n=1 Tax=Caenorhabditis tropicalis TaxID=1561998 RepID=A0A1I7UUG6_9PELO
MIVKEGALDVQINQEGHVVRIVNRPITASDREGAKSLAKMKEQQYEEHVRVEEKEMRKEFDRQYHS